jgi:two-component system sensor histidine kinase UhpB
LARGDRHNDKQSREEVRRLRQKIATLESLCAVEQTAAAEDRAVANRILELCEHDRRLIGYEIHDGFTQLATAALMQFQVFQEQAPRNVLKAGKTFDAAVELLRQAIADARRLINGRRITALEESALNTAIEGLVSESQRQQGSPPVALCWQLSETELSPLLRHAVFRIVQEHLPNGIRHRQSARTQVRLSDHDGQLRVEVRDWGVGLDVKNVPKDRLGLEGIRLWARLAGGRATLDIAPGQGTTIVVELPLAVPDQLAHQHPARALRNDHERVNREGWGN